MFFTHISQMMTEGVDLTLVMRKSADGQLTVSLMPKSMSLKDNTQNHLVPLTLNGSPAELDADFFTAAMQPVQRVTGLIANLAEFEKQADKAAADSKASKSAKEKEAKEAKDKRERYEKHIKKAEAQMTARDYDGAILSLQQARLLAAEEQAAKIDEKIAAAKAAQSQGSLFEVPAAQAAPAQSASPAPQPIAQAQPMPAAAPMPQQMPEQPAPSPQMPPHQPVTAAMPQQTAPQPAVTHPAGGYPQQPLPPMPQYGLPYPGVDPLGMLPYDNPDNPPTYRPEEYAGIVDFPQGMIAQTPGAAANTGAM